MNTRTKFRFALISSASAIFVPAAHAQVATPSSPAPPKSAASTSQSTNDGIADIVVTARKRAENLRDVPISITAVQGQALTDSKIVQVSDLAARVPNLTIASAGNLPFTLIRGFGSGNNLSFDQAVGKFVDNISYGRDQDIRIPLFDVERLEVLRGPQVLLYGNSATAGALNITTKKPGHEYAGDASVTYNFNYNEVISQGGVTVPLGQDVSLRVSGLYQYREKGTTYNVLTQEHEPQLRNYGSRAILRATPSADLTITLKAEYDRLHEEGNQTEVISQPILTGLAPFADATLNGRTAVDNSGPPFFQPAFLTVRNTTYQGDVAYKIGNGTLISTTGYRDLKTAQSTPSPAPVPILNAFLAYRYKQFSQELRYSSSFGRLDTTFGGYYQHDTYNVITAIDFNLSPTIPGNPPIPPFAIDGNFNQKQNSYSIFSDFTYHLTDSLSLEAGGRYSWIRKSANQSVVPGLVVPRKDFNSGIGALSPFPPFEPLFLQGLGVSSHSFTGLSFKDQFFQPQVVLQYKLAAKTQIFAKYVKGTKAGGFDYFYTGVPPVGPTSNGARFASEKAESLEAGIKGLILNNKVDFSLVGFRTTFANLQASQFQTASFVVTNVGKARSQGVELDVTYAPIRGLRIGASGTFLDAKYLDYTGQPCTIAQAVAHGGVAGCFQDLSGTPTLFSSKWTGTFSADYQWALRGDLAMAAGFALFARSKYNPSTDREPLAEQSGYARIDGHIDLKSATGSWKASLFGKNLTNKYTLDFAGSLPGGGKTLTGVRSSGREIGLLLGFDF